MSDSSRRLRDKNAKNPTLIAHASTFQGDLKSSAPVIVSGIVEGNCEIENILTIDKTGVWIGSIQASSIIMNGKIKGDVYTQGKIEIGPSGQVHGNIAAGSLAIASGAVIDGDMKMINNDEPLYFEEKRLIA